MDRNLSDEIAHLGAMIGESEGIVGFTGAGISTECGVPDFRSPGSPWLTNKPVSFAEFIESAEARVEAWRRKFVMDDLYAHAEPGQGHRAFASLVAEGRMLAVITQNIDNLHQRSGIPPQKIIELHGNGSFATCIDCGRRYELRDIRAAFEQSGRAPECDDCQGYVKSATISFGQPMPVDEMRRARHATLKADLFLCVGSSLVVFPAATFPLLARQNGAKLVIVNAQPTEVDRNADLIIRADIGTVLSRALAGRQMTVAAREHGG
jgi:NAD-dependent deacetylase